jgi:hypothetical protein
MCGVTYDINVLPVEFLKEFRETLGVSIDTDGFENALDVVFGGAGVAGEAEEEVCCEVLHF